MALKCTIHAVLIVTVSYRTFSGQFVSLCLTKLILAAIRMYLGKAYVRKFSEAYSEDTFMKKRKSLQHLLYPTRGGKKPTTPAVSYERGKKEKAYNTSCILREGKKRKSLQHQLYPTRGKKKKKPTTPATTPAVSYEREKKKKPAVSYEGKKKAYNTCCSQAVTHPSTGQARHCLTSVI